jgi:putative nucleotidyltransferase with HDIG domain
MADTPLPRAVLARERIESDLPGLGDLPPLPPVVLQLTATLQREDVEVAEVEAIIRRDPVIAANVLSAANAAAYASHTPTTTIRGALMRLGLLRVRRLAVLISLYTAIPRREVLQGGFWRHSLAVAHAAEGVLRHVGVWRSGTNPDVLFVAGLMHDIGSLVLASHYPRHWAAASGYAREAGVPLPEAELAVLGIDHGEIGACLAEYWSLPAEIVGPIRFHHRLDVAPPAHRWDAAVVRLADAACSSEPAWNLGEGSAIPADDPSLRELGISVTELPAVLEETRTEARRATLVLANLG